MPTHAVLFVPSLLLLVDSGAPFAKGRCQVSCAAGDPASCPFMVPMPPVEPAAISAGVVPVGQPPSLSVSSRQDREFLVAQPS